MARFVMTKEKFDRLIESVKQAEEHAKGKRGSLRTTEVSADSREPRAIVRKPRKRQ